MKQDLYSIMRILGQDTINSDDFNNIRILIEQVSCDPQYPFLYEYEKGSIEEVRKLVIQLEQDMQKEKTEEIKNKFIPVIHDIVMHLNCIIARST